MFAVAWISRNPNLTGYACVAGVCEQLGGDGGDRRELQFQGWDYMVSLPYCAYLQCVLS